MKAKPLDIVLTVFKILLPLLLILTLVWCGVRNVENLEFLRDCNESGEYPGGLGLSQFSIYIVIAVASALFIITDLICLLIAYLFRSSARRAGHIRYFGFALLMPAPMTLIYWIIYKITYAVIL